MEKATKANLLRGETGMTWLKQGQECKNYIRSCGVCQRYKGIKSRPPLGPSLVRVNISLRPFEHVSIDPLRHVRITTYGSNTQKVYPLIVVDIDNASTHFEIMTGMEAKDVYLALNRVQYRFNTRIIQVYSDGGSQLSSTLLGEKCNFYQRKLKKTSLTHNL